jgi:hypothetical protein
VIPLVFALSVLAFIRLPRVPLFGGSQGLLARALGPHGREREQTLDVLTPTLWAQRHSRGANERLEAIVAGMA